MTSELDTGQPTESEMLNRMLHLVREGNRLLREQSIDRYELLSQLAVQMGKNSPEIVQLMLNEIGVLHSDSDAILSQLKILYLADPETHRMLELILGYSTESSVDEPIEDPEHIIAKEILRQEANIMAREELIDILREDLDLNRAARLRLINDLSVLRAQHDKLKKEVDLLEKILFYNPRFQIIEALSEHPEGVTLRELSSILDRRDEEILDLLKELEANKYVVSDGFVYRQLVVYPTTY